MKRVFHQIWILIILKVFIIALLEIINSAACQKHVIIYLWMIFQDKLITSSAFKKLASF